MYTCCLQIYITGQPSHTLDVIKKMPSLVNFTHIFSESDEPEAALTAKADLIISDLSNTDLHHTVQLLLENRRKEAQIILLADKKQMQTLCSHPVLKDITDVWITPMSDDEIRFRFLRWQETCKMSKDYWQTSHYLETTINNVPNLIWYKDKDGVHEKVNDSFCKAVNKTKQQVEGRRHAYIWDVEEDDPTCIESEHQVMSREQTLITEETIKAGNELRTLMCYKSPLYNLDGSVMGTVGVAIDVTKERAYEQEIVNKNRDLETLLTTTDCGIMRHSLNDSRILNINAAALRILGYATQEELIADGFNLISPSVVDEDKQRLRDSIRMLEKAGDTVNVEYRVKHKDGEIIHVMGSIKLYEENGELFCQRFLVDYTEQKLQEKKNERRQMELIQALSRDFSLVCFIEPETGAMVPVRTNNLESSGTFDGTISFTESMKQYIEDVVYEEDREMMRQFTSLDTLKEHLSGGKMFSINYRKYIHDEIVYFQMKAVSAKTDDSSVGIVLGFRSVDADIRKEMEQNTLLESALSQANSASKAKSVFLSNMSHDIRTPMNAIIGFATIAVSHIDNKDQVRDCLQKVLSSSNHLLSLINDILDMSRIESGKVQIKEQECNISELMHNLVNIIQPQVKAKQLELFIDTFEIVNEDVVADALKLNQVFINLLSNAVKYTPAGGSIAFRIMQKTTFRHGYGDYIFIIKDNGIGMSQEFVEHIFEPFERESTVKQSGIQGTGLGMAITRNIVEMMGGTIQVESEVGRGSTFTVEISLKLQDIEKNAAQIKELDGLRALVVDDDFHVCDSVSKMLKQIGMRSEWTTSGREAAYRAQMAYEEGDAFHTYIIDWQMPETSGVETARKIRSVVGNDAPIIILTAYDWTDIEEEAKAAGVTAFCAKPLFMSDLKSALLAANNLVDKDEEAAAWTLADFSGKRVLLVEDIELNREIAEVILEEAGFVVESAPDGTDAVSMVEKAEEYYYDVVLMDVQMPIMNGYEATRTIRNMPRKDVKTLPIIAMTANALEEDKEAALKNGMNAHISKPLNMDIFISVLKQFVK